MSSTLPLILSSEPVQRGLLAAVRPSRPNVAVVYATGFGEVVCFDGRPMTRSQQLMSKYRIRYEVDISDHRRTAKLDSSPLPALGDAYFFDTLVDVGFRVVDPEAVVRRNVDDALIVVYSHLIERLRPITRQHDIEDAQGAEAEINQLFRSATTLPEGIQIYRCVARIGPDAAARVYIRSLIEARRESTVGSAKHQLAVASAHHEREIGAIEQQARLAAEAREHAAMAERPLDLPGMLAMHLTKHPDETAYALELLSRHQQAQLEQRNIDDQRSMDLVRFMIERDLIQAVDVDRLRNQTLTRVQEIASPRPVALPPPAAWDDDLPATVPGRVIRSSSEPLPGRARASADATGPESGEALGSIGAGATQDQRVDTALPVYIAVDESIADPAYVTALNGALQSLIAQLAGSPTVVGALRIAIVGYAADLIVRMPMTAIGVGSYVPTVSERPGTSLSSLFEYLLAAIPDDVMRLKAHGLAVNRPTLYVLAANPVTDDDTWSASHERLTDRSAFRFAPNIIACGIGAADPALVRSIASIPSMGFAAPPDMPVSDAVARYAAFLARAVSQLGFAHTTGRSDAVVEPPAGFRRVAESTTGGDF